MPRPRVHRLDSSLEQSDVDDEFMEAAQKVRRFIRSLGITRAEIEPLCHALVAVAKEAKRWDNVRPKGGPSKEDQAIILGSTTQRPTRILQGPQMTWCSGVCRWVKTHNRIRYQVSCVQLGTTKNKEASWRAANAWWQRKLEEIS